MKETKKECLTIKKQQILISLAWIAVLLVVSIPLLMLGKYDFPSADDWSWGRYLYKLRQSGNMSLATILATVANTVQTAWDARFSNAIFSMFQPGIYGEHFYRITPYLMIGAIIISEIILLAECLHGTGKGKWALVFPIAVPMLVVELLYCPYPDESFYWYTGAVNYTFIHCMSFILLACLLHLGLRKMQSGGRIALAIYASLVAIFVGGDNFGTSLSCLCAMICLEIIFWFWKREAVRRTWFLVAIEMAALVTVLVRPQNQDRIVNNYGGAASNSPIMAVFVSLEKTMQNTLQWTTFPLILALLAALPFVWIAVRKMEFRFRFPFAFTIVTFGLYASEITANVYIDNNTGGGRQGAILWYSCCVWFLANLIYWCGWLTHHLPSEDGKTKVDAFIEKRLILVSGALAIAFFAGVGMDKLEETTTYRAYRLLRNGYAADYAAAWEERLSVLKDTSVSEAVFTPVEPIDMIMYTDFGTEEDDCYWVNVDCADYYSKDAVVLIRE